MHQQPAPLTFPCMPAPNMLGRRFAVMMMAGRIPDHVYGGTAFLASLTVPSPPQSRGFSLPRGEAPKGKVSCLPSKEGEKNFHLEELKAVSCQKLCVAAGWRHCKCPQPGPLHPVSARAECPPASGGELMPISSLQTNYFHLKYINSSTLPGMALPLLLT